MNRQLYPSSLSHPLGPHVSACSPTSTRTKNSPSHQRRRSSTSQQRNRSSPPPPRLLPTTAAHPRVAPVVVGRPPFARRSPMRTSPPDRPLFSRPTCCWSPAVPSHCSPAPCTGPCYAPALVSRCGSVLLFSAPSSRCRSARR